MNEEDIEYLDEKFPKGETKFRGEAMVLLTLAREQGKLQKQDEVLKMIEECYDKEYPDEGNFDIVKFKRLVNEELTQKIKGDERRSKNR